MLLADRYRLDAPLGRGGMGEVWRAWDLRLQRPVAVKLLAGSATAADDAVARLQHEARTAARLSHPHAVGVYDVGTAYDRCFLVMELVTGRSLAQELREEGPLAPARVAEVAAQAAAGLAAAHLRGVVHRDIKPSNLLAGEDGSVKIADFGIAQGSGETTALTARPGAVLGTSCYLSPEAAMGARTGSAADVYGLGCSLYELLTGRPPFTGEHPVAVLRRHVEDAPVPPRRLRPETSPELDAYLLRMLAKQPELRPTAEEVASWFEQGAWRGEVTGAARGRGAAGPRTLALPPAAPALTPAPTASKHAPSRHAPSKSSAPARRRAPVAGTVTAAAAIAAAGFLFAAPVADGNSPPPPSPSVSNHHTGATAPRGAASAAADAADADAAGPHVAAPGADPGATSPKRPSPATTTQAPPAAATSAGAPSLIPTRRSVPVTTSPSSGPGAATTPTPTAASGGATGPTTTPTAATPPPATPTTTPPGEGDQDS